MATLNLEEILTDVDRLPTLPDVVVRLSALVSNDLWDAADFEEVVEPDPALTTNLLRMANSAYFGMSRKVVSIRQAIMLMGVKRVFEVAASGAFVQIIPPHIVGYDMLAASFWSHSIATAILSEQLIAELGVTPPRLTFTAALLHDIGKLVLGPFLAESLAEVTQTGDEAECSLLEIEQRTLGLDHAVVGSALAARWNLPDNIEVAIKGHHNPMAIEDEEHQTLCAAIHLADGIAHLAGYGRDCGELARHVHPEVVELLGFKSSNLHHLLFITYDQIQGMTDFFASGAT